MRLDMSECMEKHRVSKLIGSPPSYVGYDEAGPLTEKIRRRPYSVIPLTSSKAPGRSEYPASDSGRWPDYGRAGKSREL
ncbi:MAG: AAA family ATPase [Oscillospiraceae bacterium]